MAFDGIVTAAMANELGQALTEGKVNKIYQPERDELLFVINRRDGRKKFYASCSNNHAGIYLTEKEYTNPAEPSSFCMLMRKHLGAGRISSVAQKDSERIIEITLETKDEMGYPKTLKLIVEIMGKHSNIVLVNTADGKIIDGIKRVSFDVSRIRQVLPGKMYEYPPSQDKVSFRTVSPALLDEFAADDKGLLSAVQGISPVVSRLIAGEIETPDTEDNPDTHTTPSQRLARILEEIDSGQIHPAVYLKEDGSPGDFHVIRIPEYDERYTAMPFETVSTATEYYYDHKDSANRVKQKAMGISRSVTSALKKLRLKRQRLGEDLLRAENSDQYQIYGELLTANLYNFKTGDKEVTVTNYYTGEPVTIPLDQRYAPAKNAQLYFKKYAKAKTAIKEKQIQMDETDRDIAYLESVESFIDRAGATEEIDALRDELMEAGFIRFRKSKDSRKKKKPKPLEYTVPGGFRVLAGRNNKENDLLTFKTAGKQDIWFHTKDIPGSHVILFTEGQEVPDEAIYAAASIAAFHSKGNRSENVPVDYTQVRHVKKPNGARPGMCIFTDNKTVYVNPKEPD